MTLKSRFEANYLLGCIKIDNTCSLYLMPIAWWILNHDMYNPDFDQEKWGIVFRDNIRNVTDQNISAFLKSIEDDYVKLDEFAKYVGDSDSEKVWLYFFIDFDKKIFVNGFSDIEVEIYLPDDSWQGRFEDPLQYLPIEMKKLFATTD